MDSKNKEFWPSRGVAAICSVGRNSMMKYLRDIGVLQLKDGNNLPGSMDYINNGWFVVRDGKRNVRTTYWTSTGLDETKLIVEDAISKGCLSKKKNKPYVEPGMCFLDFDPNDMGLDEFLEESGI